MATETRREPANDFEHWLAGSRTLPDEREPAELCKGIAAAIGSREFAGAVALLTVLAVKDPQKAEQIRDMVLAACGGNEPRAVLLAALAGTPGGQARVLPGEVMITVESPMGTGLDTWEF